MKERNYNRRYPYEYNIFRTIFYMSFLYFVVIPFMKIFYTYKRICYGKNNRQWLQQRLRYSEDFI